MIALVVKRTKHGLVLVEGRFASVNQSDAINFTENYTPSDPVSFPHEYSLSQGHSHLGISVKHLI